MNKIIKFPMTIDMIRRVNQNRSYERALLAAQLIEESKENHKKSIKLKEEAEKFQLDIQKLFKSKK